MLLDEALHGTTPVVTLRGRIDSRTADVLADELLPRIADGRHRLVIDMQGVEYVGAAGLRVLLLVALRAEGYGLAVRLCRLQRGVMDVFDASGLADRFRIEPDVAAAID